MGSLKHTYDFIKSEVEKRGGILLSSEYKSVKEKIEIQCQNGHIFNIDYDHILRGQWCKICKNKIRWDNQRLNNDYIKLEIEKRGGILLEPYQDAHSRLKIKCQNGHIFGGNWCNISNGAWCSECAGNKKYTTEQISKLIKDLGGTLLSEYNNCMELLEIQCNNGHIFKMRWNNVKSGYWCIDCNQIKFKNEEKLYQILNNVFDKNEYTIIRQYSGFKWLYNKMSGGNQRLDFFIFNKDKTFTCAIEYDGEQHFKPVKFGGISDKRAFKMFKDTQRRDKRKRKVIKKYQKDVQYFIRFTYKEKLSEENVKNKLNKKIPTLFNKLELPTTPAIKP